jgi:hypothetical protein
MNTPTTPHMNDLRQHLLDTLASLRDKTNPMEPDRARAIGHVASVLVDTARVEIDYMRAIGGDRLEFLETDPGAPAITHSQGAHNPFPVSARHRLQG